MHREFDFLLFLSFPARESTISISFPCLATVFDAVSHQPDATELNEGSRHTKAQYSEVGRKHTRLCAKLKIAALLACCAQAPRYKATNRTSKKRAQEFSFLDISFNAPLKLKLRGSAGAQNLQLQKTSPSERFERPTPSLGRRCSIP